VAMIGDPYRVPASAGPSQASSGRWCHVRELKGLLRLVRPLAVALGSCLLQALRNAGLSCKPNRVSGSQAETITWGPDLART